MHETNADADKGNPVRSLAPDAIPKPPSAELQAVRPAANLYRQHNAVIHGQHWGTITAEPAMLDVPASRYIVVTNLGPDPFYVSDEPGAKAVETVHAPGDLPWPPDYKVLGRVFLRSAGDSNVTIREFHKTSVQMVDVHMDDERKAA